MGLKVWLPLNGDLTQYGTSNISVINNGATVNTSGKIGSCYAFNGSTGYIALSGSDIFKIFTGGTQQFSIAMWVFHADATRAILFGDYATTGGIGFNIELSTGHAVRFYWNGSPDTYPSNATIAASTWSHIALTYDGTKIQSYINGIEKGSWTGTLAAKNKTSGEFRLGRDNRSDSTAFNGKMNDFRLYDHCLSLAEVQEISQGLVLHYKFDTITNLNNNLYIGSQNFTNTWVNNSKWTTANETYQNLTVKQRSGTWGGLAQNISCTNGDIFTISFYAKVDSGGQIMSVHRSSLGNVTTGLTILDGNFISTTNWITTTDNGTQWKRYWATLQINSSDITYLQWRIENNQSGKNLYIAGMKLEKGYGTKIWSLAPSETNLSSILQDSSGYNHTGSSINTVNIFLGAPRYSTSINLPDGNSAINCGRGGMVTDALTINMWIKTSVASIPCSCKASAGWDFHFNNDALVFSARINNADKSVTINDIRNTICNDTWHMLTGIIGPTMQIYIDGILKQETNIGTSITINYDSSNVIWIGAGASGSATVIGSNGMTGLFSDFRIYCTALNSDAIRQLYNVGAKIDNLQGLHSFEVIEDTTMNTIQITKYGQIKCKEIIEGNNSLSTPFQNVQFKSTGVKSNELLEI